MQEPVFFAWTRSFLYTLVAVIILLSQDIAAIRAFAILFEPFMGEDTGAFAVWLEDTLPAFLFIAALLERSGWASPSGQPRPYGLDPRSI